MKKIANAIFLILAIIAVVFVTQFVGRYLIDELGSDNDLSEVKEVKRVTLHLPTASFYTLQVGVFKEKTEQSKLINDLKELGFYVASNNQSPYKVWLFCSGEKIDVANVDSKITQISEPVVSEMLLNNCSFIYSEDNEVKAKKVVSFLCSADVLLKHSLKSFSYINLSEYDRDVLLQMVDELKNETDGLNMTLEELMLLDDSLKEECGKIKENVNLYANALGNLQNDYSEDSLLRVQNVLLCLINQYHLFIENVSDK